MAELGGVSEIPSVGIDPAGEASSAESSLDPTAAALAAAEAQRDPELAQEASAYFRKQSQLVEAQRQLVNIQTEHLHEQRAVNLSLLKLKRFGDRLRVGLQVFVILVATVIGIFGAVLIHDGLTSRSVVIERFETPHALAERGLTGAVIASGLLDHLTRIQAATRSSTERAKLTNAWERTISIAVPDTGLSIGELSQMLRERFGHDVHISGDLVQTSTDGVALTVRGTGVAPATFSGSLSDLDTLSREAAEYVFGQARPALWAAYLDSRERYAEAIAFARNAVGRTEPVERARLFDMWSDAVGSNGGSIREALSLARQAVNLNPTDWGAQSDVQEWLATLGDEEGACRAGEAMQGLAGGRPGRAPELQYSAWDYLTWNLPAASAALFADLEATSWIGSNFGPQWATLAWMQTLMHDPESAQFTISNARDEQSGGFATAMLHQMNATLAGELGDAEGAAKEWEALAEEYKEPEVANNLGSAICYVAPALERVGRHAAADVALEAVGMLTFVDCYRFKGDILDARGDWAGAQEWYSKAVRLAPSLPAGYYSWGLAFAKHGDLDGAAAKFKDANQKGPHWADPLKAWGDVLVKRGNIKDALAKYEEALKYAPNWKQLKEARDATAKQKT